MGVGCKCNEKGGVMPTIIVVVLILFAVGILTGVYGIALQRDRQVLHLIMELEVARNKITRLERELQIMRRHRD